MLKVIFSSECHWCTIPDYRIILKPETVVVPEKLKERKKKEVN